MSAVAVIVLAVVAVLLLAILLAGVRKATVARTDAHLRAVDHYDLRPYRSHAEASRTRDR